MALFDSKVVSFFSKLKLDGILPDGIAVMNPYQHADTMKCVRQFYTKFYHDSNERIFIIGINPGRFGGGLTGISFTDPVALRDYCDIENNLGLKRELSSEFMFKTIDLFGGTEKFFGSFFMTAICPLGFTKNGTNYNYYDDKKLEEAVRPFIARTFEQQVAFGANRDAAIILGRGKNQKFIESLNSEYKWFKDLVALDHPRFIMQYKRKRLEEFLKKYVDCYKELANSNK